jgi:hypothetical protein
LFVDALVGNTVVGNGAFQSNTTGYNNTANGTAALYSNTTGVYNTANGYDALRSNTTGGNNNANGASALYYNTTGYNNTANGTAALYSNTTGVYNTANGYEALKANTTGGNNTANGSQALFSNTTGSNNTCYGFTAGYSLTTGSNNTIIGTILGTAGLANTVIIGAGATERLRIDSSGNVGIGTSSPASLLDVNGAGRINGSLLVLAGNRIILNRSALDAYAHSIYSNAGNSLTFDAGVGGTGSTLMTLTDSGRLGIGTTSPGSALEVKAAAPVLTVNSAVANASSIVLQENGTTYARFRFDGNNVDIGNLYVNGATIFNAGNAERARIDSSGRLLVGTSSARDVALLSNSTRPGGINVEASGDVVNVFTGIINRNDTNGAVLALATAPLALTTCQAA